MPFLISSILQHLYTWVDALIIKMVVGEAAYIGIAQSGKVAQVVITLFMGISAGAGIVISHYFGAKDKENLKKSIHTSLIISVIIGIFLAIIGFVFSEYILRAISTPNQSMADAKKYLNIYFFGTIFLVIYNMGTAILRSTGDSVSPLIFLGICTVLNIILDLVLTPKYGVVGAAWATVAVQGLSAFMVFLRLYFTKKDYRIRFKDFKLDIALSKKILKLGIFTGIQNCVVSIAHLVMTYFYNSFSQPEIIGTTNYLAIDGFIYLPFNSFSTALSIFVGQNVGAGRYDRAKRSIKICLAISMITTVIIGLLIFLFAKNLMTLFQQQPQNILQASTKSAFISLADQKLTIDTSLKFMTVMVLSYPILVVTDTLAAAIRGAGQAAYPSIVTMLGMCVIRISFMFIAMPFINDILVVYLTYPISWSLCAIALIVYYFKGNWKIRQSNTQIN